MTSTVASSPRGLAAREAAYEAIRRVHDADAWASPAVDAVLSRSNLDARDRSFAANLAFETLRWEGSIDWFLGQVVDRELAQIEPEVLDILRMGTWQIQFGRMPDRAAVDTSVQLVRQHVGARGTGFVNGVLRALIRAKLHLPDGAGAEAIGVATGMPTWSVTAAVERFGARARAVLEAGNAPPGLVVRTASDRAVLAAELAADGWNVRPGSHPRALWIDGGVASRIPQLADGRLTVQDEASMFVVDAVMAAVVDPDGGGGPGPLVVDVCAGPGGKSTGLGECGATVVAADLYPWRAGMVREQAARGGAAQAAFGRVHVLSGDATQSPLRHGVADAVLVDAPCTGLGVVRRRPELRWRRAAGDPERLALVQQQMLQASAALVKPGGALVYSVCTWPVPETRGVVARFLAHNPQWRSEPPVITAGAHIDDDPGCQLAPDSDNTDGMYIAVLRAPKL